MSGTYTVQFNGVTVSAQQDLIEVTAASTKPLVLVSASVSQASDAGDASEELLSILIKSGQTTTGSGGSSYTPVPTDPTYAAAGFTAKVNNTTKASGGTIVTHYASTWNVRVEQDKVLPDPMTIMLSAGRRLTIELASTPADPLTCNGYAVFQEIG